MIWFAWLIVIAMNALIDHYRMAHNIKINHIINSIVRLVVFMLLIYVFKVHGVPVICFAIGGFFSFWLLFNILLNYLNHLPIDYLGQTSALDVLESHVPFIFSVWCKAVIAFGFIYAYFYPYLLDGLF